ncbi:hypothetical protein G4B88_008731 [Cannabis sativa]|uniref:peroxidase n=1 Tax=Cannabis sativa TaxID=3483 RepID=A0A7J6GE89_CANSA|nr:hypothetical protein G4B88_008731 [Cannabis sativa]
MGLSSSLKIIVNLAIVFVVFTRTSFADDDDLSSGFYSKSCPKVFSTVKSAVHSAISNERRIGASLLRLHFHDCFVNGHTQLGKQDVQLSETEYTMRAILIVHLPNKGKTSVHVRLLLEITMWQILMLQLQQSLIISTSKSGLLHSDQILFNGGSTDSVVKRYSSKPSSFAEDFVKAMIKMGDIEPLTGSDGEIRKHCAKPN